MSIQTHVRYCVYDIEHFGLTVCIRVCRFGLALKAFWLECPAIHLIHSNISAESSEHFEQQTHHARYISKNAINVSGLTCLNARPCIFRLIRHASKIKMHPGMCPITSAASKVRVKANVNMRRCTGCSGCLFMFVRRHNLIRNESHTCTHACAIDADTSKTALMGAKMRLHLMHERTHASMLNR